MASSDRAPAPSVLEGRPWLVLLLGAVLGGGGGVGLVQATEPGPMPACDPSPVMEARLSALESAVTALTADVRVLLDRDEREGD